MQKRSPSKRRPRLSQQETTDRMIQAGLEMVDEAGLQVSFDLLRLEEVIKRADVSRVAVYRHWVTKEAYFTDLLVAIAERGDQPAFRMEGGQFGEQSKKILDAVDLQDHESQRRALIELCRLGADETAKAVAHDKPLAIRMALYATLVTMQEDNEALQRLSAAMKESEEQMFLALTETLVRMADRIGWRSRCPEHQTFERVAALGAAFLTGQAFHSQAVPEVWEGTMECDPFETGETKPWSLVAMGFTALMLSLINPNPEWTPPAK